MYLSHNDFVIRNATAQDAPQLAAWWNDGAVMAHAGFPNGLGTTAHAIAESLATDSDDTRRRLIIEQGSVPIGEMSYRNVGGGTAEIGIKICDFTRQNKGLGKVLLSMLITSLFRDYGYEKIVLDTNLTNTRAQHVYEQLGFTKLRINTDSWRDQLGRLQSAVDYELTEDKFVSWINK